MEIRTYTPERQRHLRNTLTTGVWEGGKYLLEEDFLLSDVDMANFLEFLQENREFYSRLFPQPMEAFSTGTITYAESPLVIVNKRVDRVAMWLDDTVTEQEFDFSGGTQTVDVDLPSKGTLLFVLSYVGDGDYVTVTTATQELKVFVKNSKLYCEVKKNKVYSFVELPEVTALFPVGDYNCFMFAISWNDSGVYAGFENVVKHIRESESLAGGTVETLQDTFEVILFDEDLTKICSALYLPIDGTITINIGTPEVTTDTGILGIKGNLLVPTVLKSETVEFVSVEGGEQAKEVVFEEI